jgi:hypothetical protein
MEQNDLNREDEERESIKQDADREYPKPFEGMVNVEKIVAERDELDRLVGKMNEMVFKLEEDARLSIEARDSYVELCAVLKERLTNFEKLLPVIGEKGECRGCGAEIYWVHTKNMKKMPVTIKGLSHFADCPKADQFRGGKHETKTQD